MIIEIKDKAILNSVPDHLVMTKYSEMISVAGDIPANAFVEINITGLPFTFWFPLEFTGINSVGNSFIGKLNLTDSIIEYIRKNSNGILALTIKVNSYVISGSVPFTINMKALMASSRAAVDNDYRIVIQEIAKLNRKLDIYISKNHTDGLHITDVTGIKPGMVPIALDEVGHFYFDYPFVKLEAIVQQMMGVLNRMNELNELNTARLGKLELELYNHTNNRVL